MIAYVINVLALGDLLGRKLYATYSKYVLVQKRTYVRFRYNIFLFLWLRKYSVCISILICFLRKANFYNF